MRERRLPTMIQVMSLGWGLDGDDEKVEQECPEAIAVASPSEGAKTRVLIFADMDKAQSGCGCGQMIRLVRMSGFPGVLIEEVHRDFENDVYVRYGVTQSPVVLFIDDEGREYARFEGEAPETIGALQEMLGDLRGGSA